ncbi:unnamed protein product [Meloidogyne enterolobii]|uniref:Uncharacterized protein n=1 Tax=Meloidogyne enterolobii TaxID=390850 RepID=A0ACB0XUD5_MELEN
MKSLLYYQLESEELVELSFLDGIFDFFLAFFLYSVGSIFDLILSGLLYSVRSSFDYIHDVLHYSFGSGLDRLLFYFF